MRKKKEKRKNTQNDQIGCDFKSVFVIVFVFFFVCDSFTSGTLFSIYKSASLINNEHDITVFW